MVAEPTIEACRSKKGKDGAFVETVSEDGSNDTAFASSPSIALAIHKERGRRYYERKDYGNALEAFEEAFDLAQRDVGIAVVDKQKLLCNQAACNLQLGGQFCIKEAEQQARYCVALDPMFIKGHLHLAEAHRAQGNYGLALEALNIGLDIDPDHAAMHSMFTHLMANAHVDQPEKVRKTVNKAPKPGPVQQKNELIYLLVIVVVVAFLALTFFDLDPSALNFLFAHFNVDNRSTNAFRLLLIAFFAYTNKTFRNFLSNTWEIVSPGRILGNYTN